MRLSAVSGRMPAVPHFNSRTRVGCDEFFQLPTRIGTISTHAPTKGATIYRSYHLRIHTEFQLTHPQRVRHGNGNIPVVIHKFQLTHPQRVRQQTYTKRDMRICYLCIYLHLPTVEASHSSRMFFDFLSLSISFSGADPSGIFCVLGIRTSI